jgi:type II secretory pathway component PulF
VAAFEYQALDQNGRKKKGVLEGDSPRQIRQILKEKSWIKHILSTEGIINFVSNKQI